MHLSRAALPGRLWAPYLYANNLHILTSRQGRRAVFHAPPLTFHASPMNSVPAFLNACCVW